MTAGLLLSVSTAHAARPLNIDCDLLEETNSAIDDLLDEAGIGFNSLGDLIALMILDDAGFAQLNALYELLSGGEISFVSGSQFLSTNGKCGLIPQLVEEIRD